MGPTTGKHITHMDEPNLVKGAVISLELMKIIIKSNKSHKNGRVIQVAKSLLLKQFFGSLKRKLMIMPLAKVKFYKLKDTKRLEIISGN